MVSWSKFCVQSSRETVGSIDPARSESSSKGGLMVGGKEGGCDAGVAALSTVCQRGTSSPHHKISPYGLPVPMVSARIPHISYWQLKFFFPPRINTTSFGTIGGVKGYSIVLSCRKREREGTLLRLHGEYRLSFELRNVFLTSGNQGLSRRVVRCKELSGWLQMLFSSFPREYRAAGFEIVSRTESPLCDCYSVLLALR